MIDTSVLKLPEGTAVIILSGVKEVIPVSREVFIAFSDVVSQKKTGSVTVHLKSGGIVGVETRHVVK